MCLAQFWFLLSVVKLCKHTWCFFLDRLLVGQAGMAAVLQLQG